MSSRFVNVEVGVEVGGIVEIGEDGITSRNMAEAVASVKNRRRMNIRVEVKTEIILICPEVVADLSGGKIRKHGGYLVMREKVAEMKWGVGNLFPIPYS